MKEKDFSNEPGSIHSNMIIRLNNKKNLPNRARIVQLLNDFYAEYEERVVEFEERISSLENELRDHKKYGVHTWMVNDGKKVQKS